MLKCRITYFAALVGAIVFYVFYSEYLSFFTLIAVILLPILSLTLTLFSAHKTDIRFEVKSPCVSKAEDIILDIVFHNRSAFPIAQTGIKFTCVNSLCGETQREAFYVPVNAGNGQAAEYTMKSQHCGKITVKLTQIKYYDYLGLFTMKRKPDVSAEVFVMPKTQILDAGIDTTVNFSAESNTYSKEKPGDDPSELFDIRPYQSGDKLRSIHWKLSSKLDELMVKEFSLPTDSSVLLLVELIAEDMTALDTVIETLTSLSHFLLENQISHHVEWYDVEHDRFIKSEIGNDGDSPSLLNAILSARQYKEEPHALLLHSKLSGIVPNYPHTIYITGQLVQALTSFCDRPEGEKITVLYCGETDVSRQNLTDCLQTMNVRILNIKPDRIQESLSRFML